MINNRIKLILCFYIISTMKKGPGKGQKPANPSLIDFTYHKAANRLILSMKYEVVLFVLAKVAKSEMVGNNTYIKNRLNMKIKYTKPQRRIDTDRRKNQLTIHFPDRRSGCDRRCATRILPVTKTTNAVQSAFNLNLL